MIERFIDYLQFTARFQEWDCIENQYEAIPPMKFYKRGYRMPNGIRLFFGNPNPKATKAFCVASGQTMQGLRDSGLTDKELLYWIFHEDATVTRLDMAVTEWNTFDGLITVEDVIEWFKKGLIISPLASSGCKFISSQELSRPSCQETVYIGDMQKRGSKGIFRAYDKGIELDLGKYMSTRLELEDRGDKAHSSAKRLMDAPIGSVFRSRFDVKHKDFDRLMEAPAMDISRGQAKPKRTQSEESAARWEWLIKQVAPALYEACRQDRIEGRGDTNLAKFISAAGLDKEIRQVINERVEFAYKQAITVVDLTKLD